MTAAIESQLELETWTPTVEEAQIDWPKMRGRLYLDDDPQYPTYIQTANDPPGWWHRFWCRFLLGWKWKKIEEADDADHD